MKAYPVNGILISPECAYEALEGTGRQIIPRLRRIVAAAENAALQGVLWAPKLAADARKYLEDITATRK